MTIGTHICPHCKTKSTTDISGNHYDTCRSCGRAFIKYDPTPLNEELIESTETMSPIIIGSKGNIGQDNYEVTGSITIFLNRSTVNLYSILYEYGLYGFILECDGDYTLIDHVNEQPPGNLKETRLAKVIEIKDFGAAYCFCLDKTNYISIKGSGKMIFPKFTNAILTSFYSKNKKVAYCFFSKDSTTLLIGKLYPFDELNLTTTRSLNDWYK
jgi:hypothetical protein